MSGGPEAFAVTGGRAATTHDTDPSKTPFANTDKPVPVRVTPGILTAAEIEKLNLDVRNLDAPAWSHLMGFPAKSHRRLMMPARGLTLPGRATIRRSKGPGI